MDLIDYLRQHFLTRAQLLARTGLAEARFDALQRLGMLPGPSYRLRLDLSCDSFFGPHRERHALEFYAPGQVAWAALVDGLETPRHAFECFAARYRRRLAALATDGMLPDGADLAAEQHIAAEWRAFLDGTYGLCTRSGLPEEIADKEAAIALIRELTGPAGERALTDEQSSRLAAAVELLDRASSLFAPHERARSSRRRWVDELRARCLPRPDAKKPALGRRESRQGMTGTLGGSGNLYEETSPQKR